MPLALHMETLTVSCLQLCVICQREVGCVWARLCPALGVPPPPPAPSRQHCRRCGSSALLWRAKWPDIHLKLQLPAHRGKYRLSPRSAAHAGEPLSLRAQYIWSSIWPSERLRQREFMTFGMEVLLKLDLPQTRKFFSAFFALSDFHWKGFLSSRLSLPELIVFGLALFVNLESQMKVRCMPPRLCSSCHRHPLQFCAGSLHL